MEREKPDSGRHLIDILEHAVQRPVDTDRRSQVSFRPPVDVKENLREVVVFADVPGMDEDDIDISMEGGSLVVSGCREFDLDSEDPDEFSRIERPYGVFRCVVNLPCAVNFELATARYKRGVLKVRIPKPPAGRRTIVPGMA